MKLSNLKIGVRLGLGFSLLLLLIAIMSATSLWRLGTIDTAKDRMVEATREQNLVQEWLRGIATNSVRTFALARTNDPADKKMLEGELSAQSKRLTELQKELESVMTSPRGRELMANVASKRTAYTDFRKQVFQLKGEGKETEARQLADEKMMPAMKLYIESVSQVLAHEQTTFKEADTSIEAMFLSSKQLLAGITIAALAIGVLLAWRLSRSITAPLEKAVRVAQMVSSGNLTARIDVRSSDETGQLLLSMRNMNDSLTDIVGQVRTGTEAIASASSQVASGSVDLAARTEAQASSLEETASSMDELTSTVRQNADNARQASELAAMASGVASEGSKVIGEVIGTMQDINGSSREMTDIINVIDSIAFQTNILALNAAVEAARAGEQGRGFAVVATEVRTLAQRSAGAAKEIKRLIEESSAKADNGSKLVGQAGQTMQQIVESTRRVADIMADITVASQEQSAGIQQINQAISQMDAMTQQNASLVEEATAAAQAMREQAVSLAEAVSVFQVGAAVTHARPAMTVVASSRDALPAQVETPRRRIAS
ncbi:HAMP domain-containing protein [Noviherbaspirillum sp. 17J57-3]|uniref:HAMP domain-containing protein n=2 Tax=Noviherbaspirillum galbum TaxID=2709383 RepID=A0A6B3SZI6_9BURK|nr:HAMP domain-containing protein [Noviherbaspirillum galbum]